MFHHLSPTKILKRDDDTFIIPACNVLHNPEIEDWKDQHYDINEYEISQE